MLYYVCNNPDPMEVPWGVNAKLYTAEAEAFKIAVNRAELEPGRSFYVHEFSPSKVSFRARGVVSIETEYLHADPQ